VPATVQDMGANAVAFVKALGLTKVDVLGFSIGRFVAQEITLQAPDLVRRLILLGPGRAAARAWKAALRKATEFSGHPMLSRISSG
jgi:pimeloyl-ACP methyl ester carboxylesterase